MLNNARQYKECGLCKKIKKLSQSHIYPKFFFNAIKEISPTQKFRHSDNMDKSHQDGLKFYFLCDECESKFSKYERIFKNKFFDIIKKNKNQRIDSNNGNFKYFLLSLFWRIGMFEIYYYQNKIKNEDGRFTEKELDGIKIILETYRKILLNEKMEEIEKIKMYFLPIRRLQVAEDIKNKLIRMHRTDDLFEIRMIMGGIRTTDDKRDVFQKCYISAIVPYCLFLINIWGNCEIDYLSGYEVGQNIDILSDCIINLEDDLEKLIFYSFEEGFVKPDSKMSQEVRQKIIDAVNKNLDIA
ncbi:MAG: hypothetical protein ACFNTA_06350 [Campylobacter sp.]|uniref:hypothetical protein n=1 Tax=Campylobacter sp. TaxID=205 RepID=UPI0036187A2C